ncbi:sensor histidine kinase [Bradyrhizobium sp. 2TAF24]|uniref:sensor histidine kinase n=1 Tax=Bradyrhizobium sp. 2TAF24 TaxID=3233011 RepID=UPI003F8E8A33
MKLFRPASLKRRLIWQLLALQYAILTALVAVIVMQLIRADLGGQLMDTDAIEVIGRAIQRQPDGRLAVTETADLRALKADAPGLWFVARNAAGDELSGGTLPEAYRSLVGALDRISFSDIRDTQPPYNLAATIRSVETSAGTFTVLAGAGRMVGLTFAIVFLSQLLLIPILILLALIALIAIPLIIGRAFSGIATVAAHAEEIDIDRRGTRLSVERIPAEVGPLVHAINGALQRLDEGYEQHQRFLSDAAHELRTPIAILQTRLELLPPGAMRTRLMLDTSRIAALAEQLLDMQRLDRSDSFATVDLCDLCRKVAADLAPLAIASGYQLTLDTPPDAVKVTGDCGALTRAITNLVQNAIEHAGRQGAITIAVGRDGSIDVIDEGPGIPEQERDKIFAPFYRLQPQERGAGLGLNLVRDIVRRHGGHVSALAAAPGGARFRLVLPLRGGPSPVIAGE